MGRDEHIFEYVMDELDNSVKNEALWIKAYAMVDGASESIKPRYIQYRVEEIKSIILNLREDYTKLSKDEIDQYITGDGTIPLWMINIWKWADENNLSDTDILPRTQNELRQLTILDLWNKQIVELPKEIGNLHNLTEIKLGYNKLTKLPEEFKNLVNVTSLEIMSNNLTEFPTEICNLINLTELSLWNNTIEILPKEVGNLINLSKLDLNKNKLTILPDSIVNLINLEELGLCDNSKLILTKDQRIWANKLRKENQCYVYTCYEIYEYGDFWHDFLSKDNLESLTKLVINDSRVTEFPKNIFEKLPNLQDLCVEGTEIQELPTEIGSLRNLRSLILKGNKIHKLPREIGSLRNLKTIEIWFSKISKLPKEIGNLENLELLCITRTRIRELPKEISSLKSLKSLNVYMNSEFSILPKEVGNLEKLEYLQIADNSKMQVLPKEVGNLTKLRELILCMHTGSGFIGCSPINYLPIELSNLKKLELLVVDADLEYNLPKDILNLPNLKIEKLSCY